MHNLAMAFAAQGRFREASQELRAALAQVRGTSSRAPLYLSNLAFLLAEQGDLAEARRAAEEGLQAARRFSNRAQETSCHQALAQILAQSGDLDGALSALRHADELNSELRIEVIAADVLALRGRIFCGRGEYRRGVEFLNEAIERLSVRPDDPRLIEYKATLAWCELRAGRPHVARDLLLSIVVRADADENEDRRMRIHYWLAETLLALAEKRAVNPHLSLALRLVRKHGYLHFLKVQAREEPAPLLYALAHGMELTTVSAALVEAGAAIEEPLLDILAQGPTAVGEAAITVLAEVGGIVSRDRIEQVAKSRRALRPAIRTARRHLKDRLARGASRHLEAEVRPARLTLFGPPQLHVDGQPVPASAWRAQRAFQVLVYLSLHPRGASKDDLLERFWPGRQAAAGRRNFHPTLSYIRHVLPPSSEPPILREGEFYRLNPAFPLACDAWDLERALAESRGAREAHERRPPLRRAAALATGTFLQGIYADWADELQVRTRERVEKLLLELAGLCAQAGDYEEALEHFRRAAELDEYREATRLAVIECQIKLGNRRAALVEYEKLKELLRAELGVEPLPETQEAMTRLLDGDGVHGWPDGARPTSAEPKAVQRITAISQVPLKRHVGGSKQ
jgi:DNA-binding SARP family transcriptional activator